MIEGLLSVPQLAALLGLNRSSVYRRVASGDLEPSTMVGNRALFTPERAAAIHATEQARRSGGRAGSAVEGAVRDDVPAA